MKTVCWILLTIFSATGCADFGSQSDGQQQRVAPRPLTSVEKALVSSDNTFGFKLFAAVNGSERGKNLFLSPLSVSMALGMTLNGAGGTTKEAMMRTLECAGMTQDEINQSYASLMVLLRGLDPSVTLQIANSIWHRPDLQVEPAFKDANRVHFEAEVNSLDFSSPQAAPTINNWVKKSTNGRIEAIVDDPIARDIVMYLINAVYFKGTWTYKFDPSKTQDAVFTLADGSTIPCRLMGQKATLAYYAGNGFQMVDLPYGDAGFSMTVILPDKNSDIDAFASSLTQDQWASWCGRLQKIEGDVFLPKFRMEYEKRLNDMLAAMGMEIAFSPSNANFSNIDRRGGLFISEVKHKTFLLVDEEGTEAAGVTSIGVGRTSVGDHFTMRVDHPFLLVIRDSVTGTILFIGKIMRPSV